MYILSPPVNPSHRLCAECDIHLRIQHDLEYYKNCWALIFAPLIFFLSPYIVQQIWCRGRPLCIQTSCWLEAGSCLCLLVQLCNSLTSIQYTLQVISVITQFVHPAKSRDLYQREKGINKSLAEVFHSWFLWPIYLKLLCFSTYFFHLFDLFESFQVLIDWSFMSIQFPVLFKRNSICIIPYLDDIGRVVKASLVEKCLRLSPELKNFFNTGQTNSLHMRYNMINCILMGFLCPISF